ncbi:hypothetical protein HMPREF0444_0227 [Granulicatella adiacens ATCC 49175]|uniref:Uncharacterized protein n=1 Tax=Granulicatella adiacens ATCC 49175 TaxID=638301 RepID=C8NE82_9LACT|nr:hypothetical protein HMPREF0444_0227 [Granulicatella adiacens ATCC 49175]
MQDYTEPSLNNRIREKAIRNESLDRNTEKNVKRSAVFREAELHSAKFRVSDFSSSTTQDVSNRAQKWNVGPERRKGLGTSRAYVWGNARHFCDCELNYAGWQKDRRQENPSQCEFFLLCSLSPA